MAMSTLVVPVLAYSGLGQEGAITLEEHLELATRKVEKADSNPATGSGTPYLDALLLEQYLVESLLLCLSEEDLADTLHTDAVNSPIPIL